MAPQAPPPATEDDEVWAAFGARLSDLAEKAGLRHWQLAKKVGLSRSYVTRLINGKRPNANLMPRFAKALGVELEELMGNNPMQTEAGGLSDPGATLSRRTQGGGYTVKTLYGATVAQRLEDVLPTLSKEEQYDLMQKCLAEIDKAAHRRPSRQAAD